LFRRIDTIQAEKQHVPARAPRRLAQNVQLWRAAATDAGDDHAIDAPDGVERCVEISVDPSEKIQMLIVAASAVSNPITCGTISASTSTKPALDGTSA